MIDKVEFRVQHFMPYTCDFSKLDQELRNDPKGTLIPAAHYLVVCFKQSVVYSAYSAPA